LIESCIENGVKRIYVAIDGPKENSSGNRQTEILDVIELFKDHKEISFFTLLHSKNLGVGVAVITAIDWFFTLENFGHILEDDLRVNSGFFEFSKRALRLFAQDQRVLMICGTEITGNNPNSTEAIWCHYPMIWGWSTWKNRWLVMRRELLQSKSTSHFSKTSIRDNYWAVGANRVQDGKVDTWDTPLAASFVHHRWLSILPPVNLVSNKGNDTNASHTSKDSFGLNLPIQNLKDKIDFFSGLNIDQISIYNTSLEKNVFRIRIRHYFLPLYGRIFDKARYKNKLRPLSERLNLIEI
jgi:hypothetical protein